MPVPPSVEKLLIRKEALAEQRLQKAREAVRSAELELDAIREARAALDQSGHRVSTVRDVTGPVRLTNADKVLSVLQRRPRKGMTRVELAELLRKHHEIELSLNSVSTYLSRLSSAGLAEFDGEVWRPTLDGDIETDF